MPADKTKTPKRNRIFRLEFSMASAFFWSLGLIFVLAWIFVLGILVGRGYLPEGGKTLKEMKLQIARLQDMIVKKDPPEPDKEKELTEDPEFQFYNELSLKKESVTGDSKENTKRINSLPGPSSRPGSSPEGLNAKDNSPLNQVRQDVHVKIIDQRPETNEGYVVQVASLESENKATEMVARLKSRNFPAYTYKVDVNGKTYYRIRCGIFETVTEAKNIKWLLAQKEGITGFITTVDK